MPVCEQVEKVRTRQLAAEVGTLRLDQQQAEREMSKLAMRTQRAQQAAERSEAQLGGAKGELAALQVGRGRRRAA